MISITTARAMARVDRMEIARSIAALPCVHGGRDERGVDCVGTVWLFHRRTGVLYEVPDSGSSDARWFERTPRRMLEHITMRLGWTRVRGEPAPGDVLLWAIHTDCGDHPSVVVEPGWMLHSLQQRGRVDDISCIRFGRLAGVFRPWGI